MRSRLLAGLITLMALIVPAQPAQQATVDATSGVARVTALPGAAVLCATP